MYGQVHHSLLTFPDGRILMTYVARIGELDGRTYNGHEAVIQSRPRPHLGQGAPLRPVSGNARYPAQPAVDPALRRSRADGRDAPYELHLGGQGNDGELDRGQQCVRGDLVAVMSSRAW